MISWLACSSRACELCEKCCAKEVQNININVGTCIDVCKYCRKALENAEKKHVISLSCSDK